MQLDLLPWQPKEPELQIPDPNDGKFDRAIDYFWEYATSGAGIDQFMFGTMVTVFMVTVDEKRLFPELHPYEQVVIWEDEVEGIKMFSLTAEAKCFVCNDYIRTHERTRYGDQLCDGIL